MSIMDMFRPQQQPAQQGSPNTNQPQAQGQQGAAGIPQAFQGGNSNVSQGQAPTNMPPGSPQGAQPGTGTQQTMQGGTAGGQQNTQPLDSFKDLWKPQDPATAPKENPL